MYRAFVDSKKKSKAKVTTDSVQQESDEKQDDHVDESIQKDIERVWRAVEKQCGIRQDQQCEQGIQSLSLYSDLGWITIRVFVSSTFIDFFNEREVLVKKVFPELRDWCSVHGMKLIECDLRWGIPKDTSTGDTILVCLDEIQRCQEENKGKPFFIGLIGSRYGWVPKPDEVPEEAKEKYEWIDGSSITFNEILTGAIRDKNPNAAFFLREENVYKAIPEQFYTRFVESEPSAKHHLKRMKQELKDRFGEHVFPYSCMFKEISTMTGREQVQFIKLEDFAQKVLNFLKNSIQRTYPDIFNKCDKGKQGGIKKQEQVMQLLYVMDKSKNLIGRQNQLEMLRRYIANKDCLDMELTEAAKSSIRNAKDWDLRGNDNKICVLHGASGLGKSAILCRFVNDCIDNSTEIFYHMIGSTPSSNSVETLLERLVDELSPGLRAEEGDKKGGELSAVEKLKLNLREALSLFRDQERERTLVICIDALDQLESRDSVQHLSWLPPSFPCNIHCVVSTSNHVPTTARLYEFPVWRLNLQPLGATDLQTIMTKYLGNFNKRLETGQVEKIIQDTQADSPLWVMLMAEELRVFGDFRLMATRISAFPKTMEEFLVQVLRRLIQEDEEHGVIKKVLCLLACSRHCAMPSQYLLQLCGDLKTKDPLPFVYLAQARRALRPYLRVANVMEDSLSFAHEAVNRAVESLLLPTPESRREWHSLLASFFESCSPSPWVKVYHVPYHLKIANFKKRLVDFLTTDKDSYFMMPTWQRNSFIQTARCRSLADEILPSTGPVLLCHACVTFRRYHTHCTWPTKDCCVLCSAYCPDGSRFTMARACMMHAGKRGPNLFKCWLCIAALPTDKKGQPMAPTQGKLCHDCGFGVNAKRCCHLDV